MRIGDRGSIVSNYKIWNEDGSEYLVRFNTNPPGITYPNENTALTESSAALAAALKMTIVKETIDESAQYKTLNSEYKNSTLTIYTKHILRGNELILLFESQSKKKNKNERFFNDFRFLPIQSDQKVPFSYDAAKFKMSVPPSQFYTESEEDGSIVKNYSFVDSSALTTIDLEISNLGKYKQLDLSDEAFSRNNILDSTLAGKVIDYSYFKKNGCPTYLFHRQSEGNNNIISELGIYCNDHSIIMTAVSPNDSASIKIIDDYISTIHFDTAPDKIAEINGSKSDLLLKDLESKERTTFDEAANALIGYENFTVENVPGMVALLHQSLLDDAEDFNSKYQLVTILHNFEDPAINETFFKLLVTDKNNSLRTRILESLSLSTSPSVQNQLLTFLSTKSKDDKIVPPNIYEIYSDSLDLFLSKKNQLIDIAEKGVATAQFINLYLDHISTHVKHPDYQKILQD